MPSATGTTVFINQLREKDRRLFRFGSDRDLESYSVRIDVRLETLKKQGKTRWPTFKQAEFDIVYGRTSSIIDGCQKPGIVPSPAP